MRPHAVALSAAVLAALCSAPLLAQGGEKKMEKMGMPKAPAELSQLGYFAGTWSCTGTGFANPMAPEHKTAATVKGTMSVGGFWLHLTYDEKAGGNPMPIHYGAYLGFDAAQKKFVMGCVDNMGSYCTQTSAGWSGDTMVFEGNGNMGGQKVPVRDTFTKNGSTQLVHLGEMQGQDGKWTKTDEETCHKGK